MQHQKVQMYFHDEFSGRDDGVFPNTKLFLISALASKNGSNQKSKCTLLNQLSRGYLT